MQHLDQKNKFFWVFGKVYSNMRLEYMFYFESSKYLYLEIGTDYSQTTKVSSCKFVLAMKMSPKLDFDFILSFFDFVFMS